MKTLKAEEVDGRLYRDHHEAEHCIGTFIAKPASNPPPDPKSDSLERFGRG
jgi:hypothetical protein